MKRPKILDKVNDPKYIPGIYNYCDRWCERCTFTDRCLNFEESERRLENIKGKDTNKFFEELGDIFKETKELILYVAKQEGIDLDNIEPDPEFEKKEQQLREEAENHHLSKSSMDYAKVVTKWFEKEKDIFKEKEDHLNRNLSMGINESASNQEADYIIDAMEVIQWYQYQIHVKLMRALSNSDELYEDIDMSDYPSDADGSAKVALIGLDRSIAAWGIFHKYFPDKSDDILDILVSLEKIRRLTEQNFPNARGFIRPGFDE